MAVESLSNVKTYQAQDAAKSKSQPVKKPVDMEVSPEEKVVNADNVTASVVKSQEEGSGDGRNPDKGNDAESKQAVNTSQAASESLKKAIAEMNSKINNTNKEAIFGVHEDTNRIMIKIVDKETKEIIKEFPPEKTLDMIAKVWEMAGIIVDEKG